MSLNPEKDVLIDEDDINDDFKMMPILMYRYSMALKDAKHESRVAKAKYKEEQSSALLRIRLEEGKITVAVLDARVATDELVLKSRDVWLESERDEDTLEAYVIALREKSNSLVNLAANYRIENK